MGPISRKSITQHLNGPKEKAKNQSKETVASPAEHVMQALCPVAVWYDPAGHATGADIPALAQ